MAPSEARTFKVDMNSLRGDRIGALLTHADDPIGAQILPPEPGDTVFVRDDDAEDFYRAKVVRIEGNFLEAMIDWSAPVAMPRSIDTADSVRKAVLPVFASLESVLTVSPSFSDPTQELFEGDLEVARTA